MLALGLALAAVIGLSLGLLGGGGSILTVPVLVYVLDMPAKAAIAMSLPVVGITSAVSAAMHWRAGNVRVRTALGFGVLTMIGAFAGARLSTLLSGTAQLALLGAVMLAASVSMLRRSTTPVPANPGIDAITATSRLSAVLALIALAVGVLTGIVGIGGGFLIVPALTLLARVPMREAVGTSLLVIALNSAAGVAGYLGTVALDWGFLLRFTAAAVLGALLGTSLASRVPQAMLKRAFGWFLLLMGAFVLVRNIHVIL